jgi:hypothetical protein
MKTLDAISTRKVFTKEDFPFEQAGDSYCTNRDGIIEGEEVSSFSPYSLMSGLGVRKKMIGCEKIYINGFLDFDALRLVPTESHLGKVIEKTGSFDVGKARYHVGDVADLHNGVIESVPNPFYKGGQSEK